jgi:hypothetical protein
LDKAQKYSVDTFQVISAKTIEGYGKAKVYTIEKSKEA